VAIDSSGRQNIYIFQQYLAKLGVNNFYALPGLHRSGLGQFTLPGPAIRFSYRAGIFQKNYSLA
jgi:hypothetical protein